jgi:hypothetical protein
MYEEGIYGPDELLPALFSHMAFLSLSFVTPLMWLNSNNARRRRKWFRRVDYTCHVPSFLYACMHAYKYPHFYGNRTPVPVKKTPPFIHAYTLTRSRTI